MVLGVKFSVFGFGIGLGLVGGGGNSWVWFINRGGWMGIVWIGAIVEIYK